MQGAEACCDVLLVNNDAGRRNTYSDGVPESMGESQEWRLSAWMSLIIGGAW